MKHEELRSGFYRAFPDGGEPQFFYAPGRVNLIGEHIDYNGGYVFPCALTLGTYAAICKRDDNIIRLASANFEPSITVSTDNLTFDPAHKWANNPKGVTKLLMDAGHKLTGFDLYIWGNLPGNAGLSSSASVNVLVSLALDTIFGLGYGPVERALLSQRVENKYLGVNCGIMDQFASAMGRKDHAILLDCSTLKYEYVPLALGDYRLVLANTNKPRTLAGSKYNERRAECEKALEMLRTVCDANNLCDLEFDDKFAEYSNEVFGSETVRKALTATAPSKDTAPPTPEEIIYMRAHHAISENQRVKDATQALNRGDLTAFGLAMSASHESLKNFYEVTGHELDSLAQAAHEFEGLQIQKSCNQSDQTIIPGNATHPRTKMLGSRMTGAGFGGCTVSIVHKDSVETFIQDVGKRYTQLTGLIADFYVAQTDDGAREIPA